NEDLNDYQVKIEIPYKKGMQSDFGDLRFTEIDGQEIPFYRQSYQENQSAIFWLKLSNLLSNSEKEIYLYYDNPSATYINQGEDVFDWYDDFEKDTRANYENNAVQWVTGMPRLVFNGNMYEGTYYNSYLNPKNLSLKNFFFHFDLGLPSGNNLYFKYRYKDENNYWLVNLRGSSSSISNAVQVFKVINGQKELLLNKWGRTYYKTLEIKCFENENEIIIKDKDGKIIIDKIFTDSNLNDFGEVKISGNNGGVYQIHERAFINLFTIQKYIQPEPIVTIEE
ncbi:DUF2341 domain-containing protein, partial [bacterium]|nr:DUF2341 domain-containing protein [bacterium]